MKKRLINSILCVMALSVCVCGGCGKKADSGATGAGNPSETMSGGSNETMPDSSNEVMSDNSDEKMTDASEVSEGIHLEFDPDTKTMLTWMAPYGVANSDDEVYIAFNNLLHQKGYDFYVNFYRTGVLLDEHTQLIYDAAASGREIDIFNIGFEYYGGLYGDLVRDGLCQELNTYLESEDGRALYNVKDELVWKCLSVDGKIYGLGGQPAVTGWSTQLYYYVNQEIAQKYEIDCERLMRDSTYFFDRILTVEEGEKADGGFEPYLTVDTYYWPEDMIEIQQSIAVRKEADGTYRAINVLEDDRIRQAISTCAELRNRGHKVQGDAQSQIESGRYFILVSMEPVECDNAIEFIKPSFLREDGNAAGAVNCIADWSRNKEAAFELLCAVYTDRELSEMLAYGIEGIHYRMEGEEIIKTDVEYKGWSAATLLANEELIRGDKYDYSAYIALSKENKEEILANPFFGNPLDCRKIKEQLTKLFYTGFPIDVDSWAGGDFDQKYEEQLQAFRDAGMDEVLEELNRQLKERGLQ